MSHAHPHAAALDSAAALVDHLRPLGYALGLFAAAAPLTDALGKVTPFLAACGTLLIGVGSVWSARLKAAELAGEARKRPRPR